MRLFERLGTIVAGVVAVIRLIRRPPSPADLWRRRLPGTPRARRRVVRFGLVGATIAAAGFLVAASGIIPIKASSGHWGLTAWFLNFAKQRSFSTYSIGIEAPPLNDSSLVVKGAGHYDFGCRPCHGAPGMSRPRITQHMTPTPPDLSSRMGNWNSAELFQIVKHGIKLTGMPAWPAQERDDEVWAMVAFLRRYPDLDAREYGRLVDGDVGSLDHPAAELLAGPGGEPEAVESCRRCHGRDGSGRGFGAFPRLDGQTSIYLYNALEAYALGRRASGIMAPLAASLNRQEMDELARHYAGLGGRAETRRQAAASAEAIERGERIAHHGIPAQRVPACVQCHGHDRSPRNPAYPVLDGQYAEYLVLQLELFKSGRRGGSPFAHLMDYVAPYLSSEEMQDVSFYYESLGRRR